MGTKKLDPSARMDLLEARFNVIEQDFLTIQDNLNKTISQLCAVHRSVLGLEYYHRTGRSIND